METNGDEQLGQALDDCRRLVRQGETLDSCVARNPAFSEDLARLVPLGGQVARLGCDPSSRFQLDLERRLLDAVGEQGRARSIGTLGRLRTHLAAVPLSGVMIVLIGLLALVGSGIGVVNASDDSLPDSPLYQVKSAKEWVELELARDSESKSLVQERLVDQRGKELERAAAARKPGEMIDAAAIRLSRSVEQAVDHALELRVRGNPRPAMRSLVAIRTMQRRLERIQQQGGPEAKVVPRLSTFLDRQERRLTERPSGSRRPEASSL